MIGVFDSGLGGLTILRALREAFPEEEMLYVADTAYVPYGEKPLAVIRERTESSIAYLMGEGCRLVIVACNTASAAALKYMQREWLPRNAPQNRVLGILVPTVEEIARVPYGSTQVSTAEQTVLLFATPATVQSGAYGHELMKRAPKATLVSIGVAGLVGALEAGEPVDAQVCSAAEVARQRLGGRTPDAVVLGCTHYPLVRDVFEREFPGVLQVTQGDLVARSLLAYRERHEEYFVGGGGRVTLVTTGEVEQFSASAQRFWDVEGLVLRGIAL